MGLMDIFSLFFSSINKSKPSGFKQLITYAGKNHEGKKHIKKLKNTIKASEKKCLKNKKALEYLCSKKVISEESGWERIKNMKYIDLLKAYMNSNEFQQCIEELSKKETKNYFESFIYFSSTYIDFFLRYDPNENNNHQNHAPQPNSNTEEDNNASGLILPLSILHTTSIFEMAEDNNDLHGELFSSWIDDNDLSRENNLFIGRNFEFELED